MWCNKLWGSQKKAKSAQQAIWMARTLKQADRAFDYSQTSTHRFTSVDWSFFPVAQLHVAARRPRSEREAGLGVVSTSNGAGHALQVYGTNETMKCEMKRSLSRWNRW